MVKSSQPPMVFTVAYVKSITPSASMHAAAWHQAAPRHGRRHRRCHGAVARRGHRDRTRRHGGSHCLGRGETSGMTHFLGVWGWGKKGAPPKNQGKAQFTTTSLCFGHKVTKVEEKKITWIARRVQIHPHTFDSAKYSSLLIHPVVSS